MESAAADDDELFRDMEKLFEGKERLLHASQVLTAAAPTVTKVEKKYVYSKWICEEYYNRKRLSEKLDDLGDRDGALLSKVKGRFAELFGAQSDDEQGLHSPDDPANFVRSCRQRIAPWVARHTKPYFRRNRICPRVYRAFAKHLVYKIVDHDDYLDDYGVYSYIKEYFKHHPRIKSEKDF